jgi:CRP/FNR family cyclic AMP-dependent transcriptional regulator
MAVQEVASKLGAVDLFHGLSPRVLKQIAESGHVAKFGAGTAVISEGDSVRGFKAFSPEGVEMHVILDGSVVVRVHGAQVATLGAGAYFGELSLVDGGPRTADVVAGPESVTTFALPKWTFDTLLQKHPEMAVPMLKVLCDRLRRAEAERR